MLLLLLLLQKHWQRLARGLFANRFKCHYCSLFGESIPVTLGRASAIGGQWRCPGFTNRSSSGGACR
uniref:Putative secreted protein n=1 Tax=Anopheles triannulatus TaxID=58253 RepID=A0A2M4B612_9DIPT